MSVRPVVCHVSVSEASGVSCVRPVVCHVSVRPVVCHVSECQ